MPRCRLASANGAGTWQYKDSVVLRLPTRVPTNPPTVTDNQINIFKPLDQRLPPMSGLTTPEEQELSSAASPIAIEPPVLDEADPDYNLLSAIHAETE